MRKGWREVVTAGAWLALLSGVAQVAAAPFTPDLPKPVPAASPNGPVARMTVELSWLVAPAADAPIVDLSMSEGRILGVVVVPDPSDPVGAPEVGRFRPSEQGVWRIAHGSERSGRIRVRVEAPLGASLNVEGSGQIVPFVLAGLIEGSQRSAPPARLDLSIERVAWDTIEVSTEGNGLVAPGSSHPLTVGLNVLSTESTEVQLRLVAELKPIAGGEPIWRQELQEVVATNAATAPSLILPVRVPETAAEGAYALEFRASWEPLATPQSSRNLLGLSRLLRRRRTPSGRGEASRRTTLVVLALDARGQEPPRAPSKAGEELEVDSFDFARPRGHRPSASGKSPSLTLIGHVWRVPDEALVEATRRDRLRGWIPRGAGDPIVLPVADSQGMPWTAVGLKSPHPERPHRLTLSVQGELPTGLGVALVAPGTRPHLTLDVVAAQGAAKPLPAASTKGGVTRFSWLVWPDAPEPVLVVVNRDTHIPVRLETVTLTEMTDVLPGDGIAPTASGPRWVAFSVNPRQAVERFGGNGDVWLASRNLGRYASSLGANTVVLPDRLADRARRLALHGQAVPDSLGPDRMDLALRWLDRQGLAAWIELNLDGMLPGLPRPDSPDALTAGLIRLDRNGKIDGPPCYQAIHPKVREALALRVSETVALRKDRGNLAGVVIRLGQGPTLLGRPDTGLDDSTFRRFVGETFAAELAMGIPGVDTTAEDRFETRATYVEAAGRLPWLAWRAKQVGNLYSELVQAARVAAPGAAVAVVTPALEDGPVGEETRRFDLLGLGPDQAWKSVGLDFASWPTGEDSPIVWRGVTPSEPGELEHDLSTSPELDEPVVSRPKRGLAFTDSARTVFGGVPAPNPRDEELALTARPAALSDELTGHALAAFDARWIVLTQDAVSGKEEQIRKFARLASVLPAPADKPAEPIRPTGVAVRAETAAGGTETVVSLVNDTPYSVLLETVLRAPETASVFDLARRVGLNAENVPGGKRVVLALAPFGVSALSIDVAGVAVTRADPHPAAGVLEELKARSDMISATLVRLNRTAEAEDRSAPPNPSFEPPPGSEIKQTRGGIMGDREGTYPTQGWKAIGDATAEIDTDRPRAGAGSLRLLATGAPASVVCENFAPIGRPSLTISTWLRADRPETKVRIWLEGQAAGQAFARQIDVMAFPDWRPTSLRAAAIPGGGLDSARMRFELLSPGRLWIDDLSVAGPVLTEPERLNARRDLLAALSAFHENRYADFARLAGSHWAHHVSVGLDGSTLGSSPSAVAERSGLIRTGEPSGSALPTPRRVR